MNGTKDEPELLPEDSTELEFTSLTFERLVSYGNHNHMKLSATIALSKYSNVDRRMGKLIAFVDRKLESMKTQGIKLASARHKFQRDLATGQCKTCNDKPESQDGPTKSE